jgi:hypothetical protein
LSRRSSFVHLNLQGDRVMTILEAFNLARLVDRTCVLVGRRKTTCDCPTKHSAAQIPDQT